MFGFFRSKKEANFVKDRVVYYGHNIGIILDTSICDDDGELIGYIVWSTRRMDTIGDGWYHKREIESLPDMRYGLLLCQMNDTDECSNYPLQIFPYVIVLYRGQAARVLEGKAGCLKLEFDVVNGTKVGTDGWYEEYKILSNPLCWLANKDITLNI